MSSSALRNVADCARLLVSDKATDRKKQIESLPFLLKNAAVLESLDRNSNRNEGFTWGSLFDAVKTGVSKEVEQLEKDVQKIGASTPSSRILANCDLKKKACSSVVRLVVRQANSRGKPQLKATKLVNLLLSAMRSEFTWNCFAVEYTNILLKEVLANRRIVRDVPSAALNEFVVVYTCFYKESKSESIHGLVMQVLEAIVRFGYFQTSLDASLLFTFFKNTILRCRSDLGISQQESLMSACLSFCKAVAVNCRLQLCFFGESIFATVCHMLEDKLSKNFKAVLIDFLQLQMACHHPNGVSCEDDGMISCDESLWKEGLHSLYEILMKELQQPGFRSRYSAKNVGLEVDFLELLVDVFHQEMVELNDEDGPCCSSTKRRKTVRGFLRLVDSTQYCGAQTDAVVSWLQLMGGSLKKYPHTSASAEELFTAIQLLHQLQLDCKRYVIMAAVLDCMVSALGAFICLRQSKMGVDDDATWIWPKIYELSVRTVSLNQCIPEGHALIRKLIESGLIRLGSELKCFFVPGLSTLSQHSLCTVATIMQHSDIHRLTPNEHRNDRSSSSFDFRLQLLNWLLPNLNGEFNPLIFKGSDRPSITLLSDVLERLTVRNCRRSVEFARVTAHLDDSLESVYMKASFNERITTCDQISPKCGELEVEVSQCNVVLAVRDKLIECLVRDCDILLDVECVTGNKDVVAISGQCCLVTKSIGHMIRDGSLSIHELANLHLCNTLQKLMSRLGELLRDLCHNEAHSMSKLQTLDAVISNLKEMCTWDGPDSFCQKMSQFCREMTSEVLIAVLFDCLYGNIFPGVSSRSSEFDPDFNLEHGDDLLDPSGFILSDVMFRPFYGHGGYFRSADSGVDNVLVATLPLFSSDRLQLRIATLLTTWCQHSRSPLLSPLRPRAAAKSSAAFSLVNVVKRITKPLLEETFNYERPFNMQLVFTVLGNLMKDGHELNQEHFEDCLVALKRLCKIYFRDGEVCILCLNLLAKLLLRLNDYYVRKDFEADLAPRNHAVHLISGFWLHKLRGNCGPFTELAFLKAIAVLGRCDRRFIEKDNISDGSSAHTANEFPNPSSIPTFLLSRNFAVAFHVSRVIPVLLGSQRMDANPHNDLLKTVLTNIDTAAIVGDGSLKQLDFQSNWTSSSIAVLRQIAVFSPILLKTCIFEIFKHANAIPASVPLAKKALLHISKSFEYESVSEFLDLHIGYLIYRWVESDSELGDSVWKLTDVVSLQEFYRKYYTVVVPVVFVLSKTELFESISNALTSSWAALVKECFPQIMAYVLPGYVSSDSVDGVELANSIYVPSKCIADSCYRNLEKILTLKSINEQMASRLNEVTVCLLMTLHGTYVDNEELVALPPSNPPSYNLSIVCASLHYIMTVCNEPNSSLVSVLTRTQDGIQNVLMALEVILDRSREPYDVYRALLAYKLFVSLVWKEFEGGLQNAWAFVLHDVVITLVQLLNRLTSSRFHIVVSECCNLLREVIESAVDICAMEFSKLVTFVINGVVPHVTSNGSPAVGEKALSLINFLVVEVGDRLSKNLIYLEPFPDLPEFRLAQQKLSELKYADGQLSLKQEIKYFLCGLELNRGRMRIEGFRFLKKQLSSPLNELNELIQDFKEARFADECSANVLYQLLVELTHVCTRCDLTMEIVSEALRCLGEVGPLKLPSNILLPLESNQSLRTTLQLFEGNSIAQCKAIIFHKLHLYLGDSSVNVKVVASNVLKSILSTASGHEFANQYKSKKAGLLFDYLHPFCSKKPSQVVERVVQKDFGSAIDTATIWSADHVKFEDFVCCLSSRLIETGSHCCEIMHLLKPICKVKLDFCTELFPYLLHSVLLNDSNGSFFKIISRQISGYFAKFMGAQEGNHSRISSQAKNDSVPVYVDKRAINVMLNVVQFLHLQVKPKKKGRTTLAQTQWDDSFRLDLDYLHVAHAAQFCSAHFSALLFVEIWCEVKTRKLQKAQSDSSNSDSPLTFSSSSPISILCSSYPEDVQAMQNLLLQIYRSIGDADGIYGCGMSHLSDASTRIQYYEHERRWDRAALAYDLALQSCTSSASVPPTGLHRTLHNLGLQHLSEMYLENVSTVSQSVEVRDFQFDCAWKTTRWIEPNAGSWLADNEAAGFNELIHCSLSALHHSDFHSFQDLCSAAYRAVALDLKHESSECAAFLRHPLTRLLTLNNLEDFLSFKMCDYDDADSFRNLVLKWTTRDNTACHDYDVMEPVLSLRSALLQILMRSIGAQQQQNVVEAVFVCEEMHARLARKGGLFQYAETRIAKLRAMCDVVVHKRSAWKLEEARIFWDREEHDTAKSLVNILLKEMEQQHVTDEVADQETSKLYAQTLSIYGNWLIEARAENPANIMQNYLEKSIFLLEKYEANDVETVDLMVSAYVSMARYADAHYRRIVDYLKSSACESKQQMVIGCEQEANKLLALRKLNIDQRRSYFILDKQSKIDRQELESMHEDKMKFLLKATENYMKCLGIGTGQDNRVFRLVSLWFQNKDNTALNTRLKHHLSRIPSHKFLPLIYQLAARLGSSAQRYPGFQKILLEQIERMTMDHPHHTLLVILALSNASKDQSYLSGKTKQSSATNKTDDTDRVLSARSILNNVQKTCLGPLVVSMERLCDALIAFSYMELTEEQKSKENVSIAIASDQPLARIGRLETVPPFTMNIKVDVTCRYDNVPTIVEYLRSFKCVGGINHPKQIRCRGSDGIIHVQLVKGNDDLRQDAVMQQVFGVVNNLLSDTPDTACRNLSIRAYTVVPLSQQSGVIQWCQNTIPFGQYLIDGPSSKGAHSRYYPKDWKISQCRTRIRIAGNKSLEEKYDTFLDVCQNLRPVFRHFFLENFSHSPTWYERRLAYVRSVATTSMVGYILGLGDRHVSNILVDKKTAEFIHIDFGIAFEQGRNLQTPETVPFRLTRDVVDGMGVTAMEGTFRRCCENTMTVLRSSQEVVLTILEVLLYDPLYHWSLTPLKACRVQRRHSSIANDSCSGDDGNSTLFTDNNDTTSVLSDESVNKLAERALHRLHQKLQGIEDGTILSVSGQVSYLIQEAIDPRNLCRHFHGWQAYL